MTGKVWALDQRQLLHTRAWLAGGEPEKPETAAQGSAGLLFGNK
jgi:hypothetical protein